MLQYSHRNTLQLLHCIALHYIKSHFDALKYMTARPL